MHHPAVAVVKHNKGLIRLAGALVRKLINNA